MLSLLAFDLLACAVVILISGYEMDIYVDIYAKMFMPRGFFLGVRLFS